MNCLRCGRETQEDHVFCERCREEMEVYPVRPGTAVMLPRRTEEVHSKKAKKHAHTQASPEDTVRRLKRQRTWLVALILILILAVVSLILLSFRGLDEKQYRPGQNYSAIDPTATELLP